MLVGECQVLIVPHVIGGDDAFGVSHGHEIGKTGAERVEPVHKGKAKGAGLEFGDDVRVQR